MRMEYVYDNTIQKSLNIMNGLRYKIYIDWDGQMNDVVLLKEAPLSMQGLMPGIIIRSSEFYLGS